VLILLSNKSRLVFKKFVNILVLSNFPMDITAFINLINATSLFIAILCNNTKIILLMIFIIFIMVILMIVIIIMIFMIVVILIVMIFMIFMIFISLMPSSL
jgi:hypothetical protein